MLVSAYTVCHSRTQMPVEVEPTTISFCEGFKVCQEPDSYVVSVIQISVSVF